MLMVGPIVIVFSIAFSAVLLELDVLPGEFQHTKEKAGGTVREYTWLSPKTIVHNGLAREPGCGSALAIRCG